MSVTTTAAFLLIALVKTPGEGGIVQQPFATLEACETVAGAIEADFTAMEAGNGVHPKVLWSCVPLPE